jgi:hypothetical protein
VSHPIVGNDASRASVKFFLDRIVEAYRDGAKGAVAKSGTPSAKSETKDDGNG